MHGRHIFEQVVIVFLRVIHYCCAGLRNHLFARIFFKITQVRPSTYIGSVAYVEYFRSAHFSQLRKHMTPRAVESDFYRGRGDNDYRNSAFQVVKKTLRIVGVTARVMVADLCAFSTFDALIVVYYNEDRAVGTD